MRRRDFIALSGAAAVAAGSVGARAQQSRTIGVLLGSSEQSDLRGLLDAFTQSLKELGWIEGRNVRVDVRWAGPEPQGRTKAARELASLHPDVIFAAPSNVVIALKKET